MSAQEQRETIIYDNIPLLIKSLTGFTEDEENFNLCLRFAESKIASHHFLSVNSHEVRRRIDGLALRFIASNYARYANRLKELCNEFTTDPLCINHYETDVQWSVLQFLLDMSRNPVTALTENKHQIALQDIEDEDEAELRLQQEQHMADMIESLVMINEPNNGTKYEESDLSEWSDDEEDEASKVSKMPEPIVLVDEPVPTVRKPVVIVSELKPPQPIPIYVEYDGSNSTKWLNENIQHSWWLDATYKEPVDSEFPSAHFNRLFNDFLAKSTNSRIPDVSTISEYSLLREIIWMFNYSCTSNNGHDPNYGFKFFRLDSANNEIVVNEHVSLASVTTQGTKAMVSEFVPYMTYSYRLRKFVHEILMIENLTLEPPQTVQCYAHGIQGFMREFLRDLCKLEADIVERDPFEAHTIVRLFVDMHPQFKLLEELYGFHKFCYLDHSLYPAHITSMYLLAQLEFRSERTCLPTQLNRIGGILFTTIQYYFHVFRNLWNTSRLDDWLHEFPIEIIDDAIHGEYQNTYRARSYEPSIIVSKFTVENVKYANEKHIYEVINRSQFLRTIVDNCLEAAHVIDIISKLGKFPNMLSTFAQKQISNCPQTEFEEKCIAEFKQWHIAEAKKKDKTDVVVSGDTQPQPEANTCAGRNMDLVSNKNILMNPADFLCDDNPLLFMVFEETFRRSGLIPPEVKESDNIPPEQILPKSSFEFYSKFKDITDFFLPIMRTIRKYTHEVLESRIQIANEYILNIYMNEFDILKHFANLRMVYLLGAGDAMQIFYSSLFNRMNNGKNWSNPYLLTVQLDGILSMHFPEMSTLFSIRLESQNWQSKQPLDAIRDIMLVYNVQETVCDVIQKRQLKKYNEVFQFLMQIKWAIWTLETQRFPIIFKKRRPYRPMNMFDLVFKRLAMVRNWVIYSVQSVHSHLMTMVIQSMGQQLPKKIKKARSLRDLIDIHSFYIDTIYEYCFQTAKDRKLRLLIEQLLTLVRVMHDEWKNLETLDEELMQTDADLSGGSALNSFDLSAAVRQVDCMENSYVACHNAIADTLSQEVFIRDREDLAALSAAFSCSCPC